MQQIADWLEELGMSEYGQRFAENGIDVAALPHLTDQDLKDIGVLLGHRRKMLAAIAELAVTSPSKHEPADGVEPKPQETAERRQVTVMFSAWSLNRPIGTDGPRRSPRGYIRLPEVRRGNGGSRWRVYSEIHGRRGAGVLRLSSGPRG